MSKYQQFIFENYLFDAATRQLKLLYSLDRDIHFTETYRFDFTFTENLNYELLDVACQTLFFMAGVSYYKTYLPSEIIVMKGQLDEQSANFLSRTYQRGLGEFFYVNRLDPTTPVIFPVTNPVIDIPPFAELSNQKLVAVGGGKDSLLSIELLRGGNDVATWSVGHRSQLAPLVEKIGLEHYWVEREWDPQLLKPKDNSEAYNGHVPISAIFGAVGAMVAVLSGSQDIVMSNEASASEATLEYNGTSINHQYSKSLEFEQDLQAYLLHRFNGSLRYYSALRPFTELRISELFASFALDKYEGSFSSCNKAYTHGKQEMSWCGKCPKCAFVFLALTPFVERGRLETLFGTNVLIDPNNETIYRQLLGIDGDKPLECVGTIAENRAAMKLAQEQYPELSKFVFELPRDYDYKAELEHSMPEDIRARISDKIH